MLQTDPRPNLTKRSLGAELTSLNIVCGYKQLLSPAQVTASLKLALNIRQTWNNKSSQILALTASLKISIIQTYG